MTPTLQTLRILLIYGIFLTTAAYGQEDRPVEKTDPAVSREASDTVPESANDNKPASEEQVDPAVLRQAARNKENYEKVIDRLEDNAPLNVYNPDLTQAYLDLAGTLTTLSEYDEAATVFEKAMQTVRVSDGLYSVRQIPILDRIMKNSETRGDWTGANATAHLMFHIARRNYPVGDERRIQALEKFGDWKFRAANKNLIEGSRSDAMKIVDIFASEIERLDAHDQYPGKAYHMASLYLGEARARMNVTRQIMALPRSAYQTAGSNTSTTTTQRCFTVRLPSGRFELVCEIVEIPNMDYYIDPTIQKNQDIGWQLQGIKRDIVDAYQVLQTGGNNLERRDAMLLEVQNLTSTYNAFVTENGL